MNSKNYRDIVLEYVDKLGEIDRIEDELTKSNNQSTEIKDQLRELKKKVSYLRQQIDDCKRKK